MKGHAAQCVDRYLELAKIKVDTLKLVSTPCIDDHQLRPEDFVTNGELSCSPLLRRKARRGNYVFGVFADFLISILLRSFR